MTIAVKELTTYAISDDGKTVILNLVDDTGAATALRFQIPDLGNLSMTLPSLIEAALRRQQSDTSFRYTYPIGSWAIEQSTDPCSLIVTLRTLDGFGVSFAMPRGHVFQLAQALAEADARSVRVLAH